MGNVNISTLEDIVRKVPKDKLELFLIDLKIRVLIHKQVVEMIELSGGLLDIEHDMKTIQWVDDNKNEANINIEVK